MTARSDLRTEVRRRIGESSTTFFSDAEINSLLDEAQNDFAAVGGIVEGDRGFALVANQYEYSPPTDFITAKYLLLQEKDKLHYVTPRMLFNKLFAQPGHTGTPEYYTVWEKVLRVFPTPASASASTQLNGAINSTVTTITVDSTSGFSSSGRLIIGTEEIHYFALTATTFTQCKRGQAGTTAASHSDNDAVSEAELRLFYYKAPTAMSGDTASPDIPSEYHYILPYYAAGQLKVKDRQYDQSQALLSFYEIKKREAWAEIRRRQRDRNPRLLPSSEGRLLSQGEP